MTRTIALSFLLCAACAAQTVTPLRLAIAGLVHSHVDGFLRSIRDRNDVQVVAVFEPDVAVQRKYAKLYHLDESIFSTDLGAMLDHAKPEAVATFTSTFDHPMVVEACAQRHIPVMMEKPLAVSMDHARAIQRAATRSGIPVVINYETTWYRSHGAMWDLIKKKKSAGKIRKMVAMDGHQGPQEIGVPPEFFQWLTDPVKNGAGALFDFGCYGANLMTWMMDNQRPIAVTAITSRFKPQIYPRVDDEATVLVEYPTAQGIIQASWNWPFNRKDFEVYGERGYTIAVGGNMLRARMPGEHDEEIHATLDQLPVDERDPVEYLAAVARGKRKPSGLSSLENNMIVVEILSAARESAATGKTIKLASQ
ncbi:MAG TPA: Gfo/Idh/MocA family oxidoreductase [Bryobacteraceae bacterium]|nr:Gfo/Idh/MocA family oxidoreductase [Bryobacteraceae bacterium]